MRLAHILAALSALSLSGCISPADGCYVDGHEVPCADDTAHAEPLCGTPGGESTTPVTGCTWPTSTAIVPSTVAYGPNALQACDYYAAVSPTGADARVMIVSSGFTGGARATSQWVTWARHNATMGIDAYVCDVRHSASGGVNPFPAPNSDARCALRTLAALSPTGHLRGFGASAGATLLDHADATADRTSLTSGTTTIALDDGSCPIAWASTDAAILTRVSLWSEPGDLRVKAKINAGSQPNMDQYLNVTGETDPAWPDRSAIVSPSLWYRAGMAPRLMIASAGDNVVYPEQTLGTGAAGLTCTSVHPTGLLGTKAITRAAGVNATSILNACPTLTHLPTFAAPLDSGACTSDIF